MEIFRSSPENARRKELQVIAKQEQKLKKAALQAKPAVWKTELEKKIPPKIYQGLESAFCKGFAAVFSKGRTVLEKSYNKDELLKDYSIRDFAVQIKGGRKELRQMHKSASRSNFRNLALTTAEGVGLGALGIGIPDVVVFISTLLKGVYETALNYGYDYESKQEQLLILKMMAAALSGGTAWEALNDEIDALMLKDTCEFSEGTFNEQIQKTASVFAVDMLLLKFIQGFPLVGILGGAANPVYYQKILKYVQLKYRKRYLLKLT